MVLMGVVLASLRTMLLMDWLRLVHQVSVITTGRVQGYFVAEEQGIKVYRFQPANLYQLEEKDQQTTWLKLIWQLLDFYNFHSAGVLQRIMTNETPDIIHVHKMRGFSGTVL